MVSATLSQRIGETRLQPSPTEVSPSDDLIARLNLPEEVTTQQAATILGCCKHTVLQFLEDGLLEWRNAAPPSSHRPVFRITLRSVLELRLAYQRASPRPPAANPPVQARRRSVPSSDYQPKHLRREKANVQDNRNSATRD